MESVLEKVKTTASQIGFEHKKVDNESGTDNGNVMFQRNNAEKPCNSRKGTQIRFEGMELHENTATVRIKSLFFTVQCGRCKNREEISNVMEKYVYGYVLQNKVMSDSKTINLWFVACKW